jgi:hypothetical protein
LCRRWIVPGVECGRERLSSCPHHRRALRLRAPRATDGRRAGASPGQRARRCARVRGPEGAPRDPPSRNGTHGRGRDRLRAGRPDFAPSPGRPRRRPVPPGALGQLQRLRRDDRRRRGSRDCVVRRPRGFQHPGDDHDGLHGRNGPGRRRGALLAEDGRGRARLLPGGRGGRAARRGQGRPTLGGGEARRLSRHRRRGGPHQPGGFAGPRCGLGRSQAPVWQGLPAPRPRRPRPRKGGPGERVYPGGGIGPR